MAMEPQQASLMTTINETRLPSTPWPFWICISISLKGKQKWWWRTLLLKVIWLYRKKRSELFCDTFFLLRLLTSKMFFEVKPKAMLFSSQNIVLTLKWNKFFRLHYQNISWMLTSFESEVVVEAAWVSKPKFINQG